MNCQEVLLDCLCCRLKGRFEAVVIQQVCFGLALSLGWNLGPVCRCRICMTWCGASVELALFVGEKAVANQLFEPSIVCFLHVRHLSD